MKFDLKQAQKAFFEDTINHFNLENRGVSKGISGCSYESGCAIGRHLSQRLCKKLDNLSKSSVWSVFNYLPGKLRRLGVDFLDKVQILHDIIGNWDEKGLSEKGRERAELIKKTFGLE